MTGEICTILKLYYEHASSISTIMKCKILPCGCTICCDEEQNRLLLCISHNNNYQHWRGNEEEFVRAIVTPSTDQMQLDPRLVANWV